MQGVRAMSIFSQDKVLLYENGKSPVSCFKTSASLLEHQHIQKTLATLRNHFSWIIHAEPHHPEDISKVHNLTTKGYERLDTWEDSKLEEMITFRDEGSNGLCINLIGVERRYDDLVLDRDKRSEEIGRFIKSAPTS